MVKEIEAKGKKLFKCGECGYLYEDRQTAEECENFCSKHNACSLEITKKAVKI